MAAQVVPLFQRLRPHFDWTPRELAQFYRVESALIQAGLSLETERGLTDEGDPWFVFCRADNGEVFIHFARVDGRYIAVGAALEQIIEGKDFPALVQEMLAAQAWAMAKARTQSGRSNVFMHPSALLIALVGAAFFHSGDAKAADVGHGASGGVQKRFIVPILTSSSDGPTTPSLDASETTTILSSVLIALNELSPAAWPTVDFGVSSAVAEDPVAPPPSIPPSLLGSDGAALPISASPSGTSATQSAHELQPSHQMAPPVDLVAPMPHVISAEVAAAPVTPVTPAPDPASVHADVATPPVSAAVVLVETSSNDAAQLVQASNILSYVGLPSSTQVGPPAVLVNPIRTGEHVQVVDAPSTVSTPAVTPPPSVDASSPPAHDAPPPGGGGPVEFAANSPIVSAAIAQFAAEVTSLDLAYSGRNLILYDAALAHPVAPGVQIESVTFNFTDGSSISLVGTASELQSLHLPFPVG